MPQSTPLPEDRLPDARTQRRENCPAASFFRIMSNRSAFSTNQTCAYSDFGNAAILRLSSTPLFHWMSPLHPSAASACSSNTARRKASRSSAASMWQLLARTSCTQLSAYVCVCASACVCVHSHRQHRHLHACIINHGRRERSAPAACCHSACWHQDKLCPAATHGAGSGDQASGFLLLLLRSFLHVGSY